MELAQMLKMFKLTEDELIGGFITTKKNIYYIVLNRKDENGKRRPLWISTELEATEENKEEAENKCLSERIRYSVDLKNGVAEMTAVKSSKVSTLKEAGASVEERRNPLFADLLNEWLAFRHPSNIVIGDDFNFDKQIKLNTWAGYADNIKRNLYPTFMAYGCTVQEVTVELLKGFYSNRLKNGLKKSSVAKDYTLINQTLNYAVSRKMIDVNPNRVAISRYTVCSHRNNMLNFIIIFQVKYAKANLYKS